MPLPDGEDACIGHIPGVKGACCGHGVDDPYVGAGSFSFGLDGMYTAYRDPEAWDEHIAKLDTNPENHPVNKDCVLVYTNPESGVSFWTPIKPIGQVPYCLHPSRDIPYEHSDLFYVAKSVIEYNCFMRIMTVPSIPEALLMAKVLHQFAGIETVEPFFTSQQWAGFIPITVGSYENHLEIRELYPFWCYDMRLLISSGSATEAPNFVIPKLPEYPVVNLNASYT